MARYIDADALIENIKRVYCTDCNNYNKVRCRACGTDDAMTMIEDAPTADVVEVVRCKDCRFCKNLPNGLCYAWTEPYANERGYKGEAHCVEPDDFCSMGQRKEQT